VDPQINVENTLVLSGNVSSSDLAFKEVNGEIVKVPIFMCTCIYVYININICNAFIFIYVHLDIHVFIFMHLY
jgi:hypothetical protein